ncbi:hypothetical protein OROHE_023322 [Orobanche hederae]
MSRWFSSLRNLTRKLKILKMKHIKLLEDASTFRQYITEIQGVGCIVQSTMDQHNQLHEVLELKGTFCRCRPLNTDEIDGGVPMAVDFEAAKDGELPVRSNGISKRAFKFVAVFNPEADQLDVFEETSPFAISVLDGYNVCIFAYGQTGTGKTFTMEGTAEVRRVNYRTLQKLFDIIEERKKMFRYEVVVSVLEVYNEQISGVLGIELGPAKKQMDRSELFKHKQMVMAARQDLKSKDFQVKKLEDANYGLEVKMKEKDVKNRNLQDKVEGRNQASKSYDIFRKIQSPDRWLVFETRLLREIYLYIGDFVQVQHPLCYYYFQEERPVKWKIEKL